VGHNFDRYIKDCVGIATPHGECMGCDDINFYLSCVLGFYHFRESVESMELLPFTTTFCITLQYIEEWPMGEYLEHK